GNGDVAIRAQSTSSIDAVIVGASAALGGGATAGVAASIGIAVARNFVGWGFDPSQSATYSTDHQKGKIQLNPKDTVRIDSGVRPGDIYEYRGTSISVDPNQLAGQDYSNDKLWQLTNLTNTPEANHAEVQAYVMNSSINAAGSLALTATDSEAISAVVVA